MKKLYFLLTILSIAVFVFSLSVSAVFAGGGQVQGDKGLGYVNQTCDPVVDSPCGPFNE